MKRLSRRQVAILEFIEDFVMQHQYAPTVREIVNGTDVTTESVMSYNLDRLHEQRYIRREPRVSRGLILLRCADGTKFLTVYRRALDVERTGA